MFVAQAFDPVCLEAQARKPVPQQSDSRNRIVNETATELMG
ncbi:hypothetical protein FTUN_1647 [Frigoriglobus tundricola]|uniref:Uncharacterized protein n=1 Tax=Frigoriglobus tundricola TaxID=2774151 RepID=A0A6M5YJH2_9BACT|nr:hypothetical protein FTUN_1647 [Frigoriglobus tundricola]